MAYASAPTSTTRSPTVTAAFEDFDPVIGRAAGYAERLQKLSDRIMGARPEPVGNDLNSVAPITIIAQIQLRRSRLVDVLDHMERSIDALEGSV